MSSRCLGLACAILAACEPVAVSQAAGADERWQAVASALARSEQGSELWLSEMGLYEDTRAKLRAEDMREFLPRYTLWSDGLEKQRWLRLPSGARIDTSDMDHWSIPVGTLLFKEFAQGGRRIETRVIARTGSGERDYWMGAFVWNTDESDARFVRDGARDAHGTGHDVPSAKQCGTCHNGEPGRVLGLSAVQQPDAPAVWLTKPAPRAFVPPGGATTSAALGYLHANCAHCHNPNGSARPDSDMDLRLSLADTGVDTSGAYRTAVARPLQHFKTSGQRWRIEPGAPERSGLWYRMVQRGTDSQMPPFASKQVDEKGAAVVAAWIASL